MVFSQTSRRRTLGQSVAPQSFSPGRPLICPELLQLQLRELKIDKIVLETGRPRIDAYIVYLFPDAARFQRRLQRPARLLLLEKSITRFWTESATLFTQCPTAPLGLAALSQEAQFLLPRV